MVVTSCVTLHDHRLHEESVLGATGASLSLREAVRAAGDGTMLQRVPYWHPVLMVVLLQQAVLGLGQEPQPLSGSFRTP
jgi:hypothetical protein